MKEYIERKALLDKIWMDNTDSIVLRSYAAEMVNAMSSVDVTEVVRCKDCDYSYSVHNKDGSIAFYQCEYFTSNVDENDFCSNGEPRRID